MTRVFEGVLYSMVTPHELYVETGDENDDLADTLDDLTEKHVRITIEEIVP